MATLTDDAIYFKQASVLKGEYQYTKQYPIEGQNVYDISTAGRVTTFQLIPNVMNLSRSFLCGTVLIPAQGANNYAWQNINGFKPIQRITVTSNGMVLMDLTGVDTYLDMVSRRSCTFSDVQTWDAASTFAAGVGSSFFEGLVPSNWAAASTVRLDNTAMAKPGQESTYIAVGGNNAVTQLNFKLGFDKFVDTLLAIDHDIYWKQNLIVTIYWNSVNSFAWLGTSNANPTTGAAALANGGAGSQIVNPMMMLALEENLVIAQMIKNKCLSNEGLSLSVPYIYSTTFNLNAGGNNFQASYTSANGSYIKKIWWGAYVNGGTLNNVYNKDNLVSAKITQFQTQLNGVYIQQFPYVTANGDDFLLHRNNTRTSDILSFNEHLYNWCYCDDFTTNHFKHFAKRYFADIPDDNLVDGLPLMDKPLMYNIQSTSAVNLSNYLYTVFLRNLRISGDLITLQ